jgi:hypothetical protein
VGRENLVNLPNRGALVKTISYTVARIGSEDAEELNQDALALAASLLVSRYRVSEKWAEPQLRPAERRIYPLSVQPGR